VIVLGALIVFLLLLVLSVPIAQGMGFVSIVMFHFADIDMMVIPRRMYQGINVFPLLAVPLFIFAGSVMSNGGLARRLVRFAQAVVGWMRGGLALVNILASMLFGGVSGAASADIASIGTMLIPAMEEEGYDREFSAAVTVTSATVGPIIPPSIPAVLYAYIAGNISVATIFIANLVPGILVGLSLMVVTYLISVKRNYRKDKFVGFKQLLIRAIDGLLGLGGFLIIVGGTTAGVFTATEAGAIAAIYSLIVAFLVYRELKISDLPQILLETGLITALVMFLVATTSIFSWYVAFENIPQRLVNAVLGVTTNKYIILLGMNLCLFLVGAFIDGTPAQLLLVPILAPLAYTIGISPYHIASIIIINLVFGLITPPVGTSLFVGCSVARLSMESIVKEMKWLFPAMIVVLFLVTFVPAISLTVPRLLGLIP
jgi:tripartite ATP-independent transporter DctM subunit